jgi:hypothetical protein
MASFYKLIREKFGQFKKVSANFSESSAKNGGQILTVFDQFLTRIVHFG